MIKLSRLGIARIKRASKPPNPNLSNGFRSTIGCCLGGTLRSRSSVLLMSDGGKNLLARPLKADPILIDSSLISGSCGGQKGGDGLVGGVGLGLPGGLGDCPGRGLVGGLPEGLGDCPGDGLGVGLGVGLTGPGGWGLDKIINGTSLRILIFPARSSITKSR